MRLKSFLAATALTVGSGCNNHPYESDRQALLSDRVCSDAVDNRLSIDAALGVSLRLINQELRDSEPRLPIANLGADMVRRLNDRLRILQLSTIDEAVMCSEGCSYTGSHHPQFTRVNTLLLGVTFQLQVRERIGAELARCSRDGFRP